MDKIKVILAEDQKTLRGIIGERLRAEPDIQMLDEVANGRALVERCRLTPPDVAVIDIRMPVMTGIEAARILREELPQVKLLVLTTFDDEEYLRALFGLGIDGYLLKADDPGKLAQAIRNVYNGLGAVDGSVSRRLGSLLNTQPSAAWPTPLTATEKRVALLIAEGMHNKEIALQLGISYGSTRNLVSKVYTKLGAVDREDLITKLDEEA